MASQTQPTQQSQQQSNTQTTILDSANFPDYEQDTVLFGQFLQEHQINVIDNTNNNEDDDDGGEYIPTADNSNIRRIPCYQALLQRVRDRNYVDPSNPCDFILEIPLSELVEWDAVRGEELANRCEKNTLRYHQLFCKVIDESLEALPMSNNDNGTVRRDTFDILYEQRLTQQQARQAARQAAAGEGEGILNDEANANNNNAGGASEEFPPLLMRRYELRILPVGRAGTLAPFERQQRSPQYNAKVTSGVSLRYVRSRSMGHLVTIQGMIVRCSDVKPSCIVATYSCDRCGCEVYQTLQGQREFLPPRTCPSDECRDHNNSDSLVLQTRGSKFEKYQELKLQELPSQVPMGHVPRSMTIVVRGELTRLVTPGDLVSVDGIFLPQRLAESGYRAMQAGLISTTYLAAHNILVHKKSLDESLVNSLTDAESQELNLAIETVSQGNDPVGTLSAAIAPEIFGHDDIKRSLLLQLVGGCTRKLPDGMRIRGDINLCFMGDPGMAKSQLLKHVATLAPRGVYTTGKGSSGVGLTAAVTKDPLTGELALEGGALVLADRGICAIDEFDKMDEGDRTAIHEVMEQQTVSIAKAGIVATLNARASVLAAANPLYGRYHKRKSLSENINLPNSLLSRFDLMFLLLDTPDVDHDIALARHVTLVHQNEGLKKPKDKGNKDDDSEDDDDDGTVVVTPRILREYITRARRHTPICTEQVAPYIVEAYVSLRMESNNNKKRIQSDQTAMTPRQLLSILRLSQALARLRFSDYVERADVDEAIRMTHCSKASLEQSENNNDGSNNNKKRKHQDVSSKLFSMLRDYHHQTGDKIGITVATAMAIRKGYTEDQLQTCLEEYEQLSILQLTPTHIYFV
mmetsp:Transcript_16650/g.24617  ORF Transcript_16650/g.24617 Transcript_16650/m.24617 type:complete len:861 (-) Transcript_16650:133-2715(-)